MAIDPALRSLDVELPASPAALVALSALLDDERVHIDQVAEVVERDLALAAAVVRTVNSAMFGLLRRVETVAEATRYLGMREVAAITFEMGLRARFPADALLTALWNRARLRGLLMGRVAAQHGLHAWRAHSAGLFAECGQAVLYAHRPDQYRGVRSALSQDATPADIAAAEVQAFGVDHARLGGALCSSWGLAADVADAVHDRVLGEDAWRARGAPVRWLLCIAALADHQMAAPNATPEASALAPQVAPICDELGVSAEALALDVGRHAARIAASADG